jgi:hypothetical protein
MGLDMYLNAKRYLWNVEDELVDKISSAFPELGGKRIKEIKAEAIYWRKSNAIHKWFVDNVQGGEDDCGDYEVSREQLMELLATIETVLNDRSQASEMLPPQTGFFFGSNNIDQWYWEDLESTKEQLEKLLAQEMPGWWFEYHSSW